MTAFTPDRIREIISTNDSQLEKAIVKLYQRQTSTEQSAGTTIHDNTVGFSAGHASKLSYYARWILSGRHLSGKHLETARRYTLHYTRQLTEIAAEATQPVAAPAVAYRTTVRARRPQFGMTMLSSRGTGMMW